MGVTQIYSPSTDPTPTHPLFLLYELRDFVVCVVDLIE